MQANDYQDGAARTICPQEQVEQILHRDPRLAQLLHSIVGMMGELGELAGAIEKHLWYGQQLDYGNLWEEFGDVAWYLAEGASSMKWDLNAILASNLKKLKKRYPERYTDHHAANRDLAAERATLAQNGQGWAEPREEADE